jgi:hypothetical protein
MIVMRRVEAVRFLPYPLGAALLEIAIVSFLLVLWETKYQHDWLAVTVIGVTT